MMNAFPGKNGLIVNPGHHVPQFPRIRAEDRSGVLVVPGSSFPRKLQPLGQKKHGASGVGN